MIVCDLWLLNAGNVPDLAGWVVFILKILSQPFYALLNPTVFATIVRPRSPKRRQVAALQSASRETPRVTASTLPPRKPADSQLD